MSDTMLRHWHMLRLIPRAPKKVDTASLESHLRGRGFDINRRSIQRDLMKLSAHFPLVVNERSRPFGWTWVKDSHPFDIPGMDLHTALAFALADKHLGHLLPGTTLGYMRPHFAHAHAVLDGLDDNDLANWRRSVRLLPDGLPMATPVVHPELLEALHDGLLHHRRLLVRYRPRSEESKQWVAHPQGLVYRDRMAYLVAALNDYDNVVQLALHRFEEVTVLAEPRRRLPGFDLDAYIASGAFGFRISEAPLGLVARFAPEAAVRLHETPLADDQIETICDDGRVQITATVADTAQLRVWIKGHGPMCEVLEPKSLREDIATELSAAVARYAED